MIIVDTNVVSEPMRPQAEPAVQNWLDQQSAETLYLTSISLAELLLGIALLPKGKRKRGLDKALKELLEGLFGSRVLPFDQDAAVAYPALVHNARTQGYTLSVADAQIAAIASVHGFTVATRDVAPFLAAGIQTLNPWEVVT